MLPEPVDYSMDQVNGPPLWRTSISSHLTPNIANIVRKFAPSIFLCVATERRLNSEKKKRVLKIESGAIGLSGIKLTPLKYTSFKKNRNAPNNLICWQITI